MIRNCVHRRVLAEDDTTLAGGDGQRVLVTSSAKVETFHVDVIKLEEVKTLKSKLCQINGYRVELETAKGDNPKVDEKLELQI